MSKSSSNAAHLRLEGVSKTYPDRRVFTDISFAVPHHDRVGIIGENGSGKTTLLRIIAGELAPEAGTVETFGHSRTGLDIGLLHQEPDFALTMSVAAVLEASVAHLRAAETAVDTAAAALAAAPQDPGILEDYATTVEEAERLGVWDTDARIEATVDGLGLDQVDCQRSIGELSGGQRARLAMANLLLSAPEVLLLDEPTNHLDDAAIRYLGSVISTWPGPVLIVSHDRAFLDETVVSIVDLDPAPSPHALHADEDVASTIGVTRFRGTYSDYLQARHEARMRWQHQYQAEQAQLKRLRAAVDGNQVVGHQDWKPRTEVRMAQKFFADRNAKVVARRVNDARARLADLEQRQLVKPPQELTFGGLSAATTRAPVHSGEPILTAENVAVTGRLHPTTLTVGPTDKILVTGPNGVGKSTLLQLLAGHLKPDGGTIQRHPRLRIGLLSQETAFAGVTDQTARMVYARAVGMELAQRVPLSTFGLLNPADECRSVATLSTGQQRRLALAIVLADPPDVVLLDEPTNHLSLVLVTELEASIPHYPGAIVIASHDRWLRNRWQGSTVHLA